jgi:DNA-binding Lrp family transcriptional regulator
MLRRQTGRLIRVDEIDRKLVNRLQDGLPVCRRPFDELANELGVTVAEILARMQQLLDDKVLSRFGPMFNAEQLGGAVTLCAMQVAAEQFDVVADLVNAHPEVAHNYERAHPLNMWFVVAAEHPEQVAGVIRAIEQETACRVYDMPKQEEFYIGLKLAV